MKKKALIFQNSKGDGPGIFSGFLEAKGWHRRIVHLYGGESIPADWSRYDFLMIMGGPMGVYDDRKHPYLGDEVNVIRRALEQSKPVIGLCLGAQLMSRALGARVVKASRQEIGWYPIEMTAEGARDPLLASFSSNPVLFLWHEDGFLLPKGAVRVAGTRECPIFSIHLRNFKSPRRNCPIIHSPPLAGGARGGGEDKRINSLLV
ncbi:MAG: type 1 glutamine amidotransferase [Deltaproteobacteria bacterium]|nr:type 1 glutamine amidotransferase [Deltaproteobacteria bacterium]MBW1818079.1 type 1 glutamine amidotransferase [Deltaproteobacteria bacterium]